MKLSQLFSPCFLVGHEEPIRVMVGKSFSWACPRCTAILRKPLKGQKPKYKQESKRLTVVKLKRRSA